MIAYQGSKSSYSGEIARIINSIEPNLPFIDGCCGSGVMTEQLSKRTIMIDAGAWGKFWHTLYTLYSESPTQLSLARSRAVEVKKFYTPWVHNLAQQPIPATTDPGGSAEFILAFLALQREAFRGKPIGLGPTMWKHPGFRDAFSHEKFIDGLQRAIRTIRHVDHVVHGDISAFNTKYPYNFYIDPDYDKTVGYYHSVEVARVMMNNQQCNFFVSHHTPLPGTWDSITEITGSSSREHSKSVVELVHVKRRIR